MANIPLNGLRKARSLWPADKERKQVWEKGGERARTQCVSFSVHLVIGNSSCIHLVTSLEYMQYFKISVISGLGNIFCFNSFYCFKRTKYNRAQCYSGKGPTVNNYR